MTAAAIMAVILGVLAFVVSIACAVIAIILTSRDAPGSVTRFWLLLMAGFLGAGWLFVWVAWP